MRLWGCAGQQSCVRAGKKRLEWLGSQNSLNVNFVTPREIRVLSAFWNVKRPANTGVFVRWGRPHSFRRAVPDSAICNKLRLRRRLQRILKSAPRWIDYRPEEVIMTFLYVLIGGLQRVNKTEILQYNGL